MVPCVNNDREHLSRELVFLIGIELEFVDRVLAPLMDDDLFKLAEIGDPLFDASLLVRLGVIAPPRLRSALDLKPFFFTCEIVSGRESSARIGHS